MDRDELVQHCLSLAGAYLDSPWGEGDNVVKVGGKIFCFLGGPDGPLSISAKGTRESVTEWRDRYPDHIEIPRYLNKQLWNLIDLHSDGCPDDDESRELVDDSYALVLASLPKSKRP